ncbi:MAG TPA: META domain-containing protein, partial [Caldilineaceae bacterium]|nr:META domain-containing protein [Caldilineaceae bacterium]
AAKQAPGEEVAALAMRAPAEAASEPLSLLPQEGITTPVGITWEWQQTTYADDTVVTAQDPALYRLIFLADGELTAQVDCNRGVGAYTVQGDSLTFSPIATTRMLCPEGSQGEQFLKDLAAVTGYELAGDTLSLRLEGGEMTFLRGE